MWLLRTMVLWPLLRWNATSSPIIQASHFILQNAELLLVTSCSILLPSLSLLLLYLLSSMPFPTLSFPPTTCTYTHTSGNSYLSPKIELQLAFPRSLSSCAWTKVKVLCQTCLISLSHGPVSSVWGGKGLICLCLFLPSMGLVPYRAQQTGDWSSESLKNPGALCVCGKGFQCPPR